MKKYSYKRISIDLTYGDEYIDMTKLNRKSIILTVVSSIKYIHLI